MSLDATSQLASALASTANEQDEIKQNLSGDDSTGILQVQFSERVIVGGEDGLVATRRDYSPSSFILDHATLGDLDSSVLYLDGGYVNSTSDYSKRMDLDTSIQPSSGTVNDLSVNNNDGTYNINMTAYYPFNGNANDESINSNNGTVTSATLAADHLGNTNNAYYFDGTGVKYIDCNNGDSTVGVSSSKTYFFMFKSPDTSRNEDFIYSYTAGGYIYFRKASGGSVSANFYNGSATFTAASAAGVCNDVWHSFCAVVNRTSNLLILYIDGQATTAGTNISTMGAVNCVADFFIGSNGLTGNTYTGSFTDFMIIPSALSATQVLGMHNVLKGRDKYLVESQVYYPFDGNANDAKNTGINGVVTGATLTTDHLGNANNAYSFDGDNDKIVMSTLVTSGIRTISVVYRNLVQEDNAGIWSGDGEGTSFYLNKQSTNDWQMYFNNGTNKYRFRNVTPIFSSSWTHDVYIWDTATNYLKIYRNGTLIYNYASDYNAAVSDYTGINLALNSGTGAYGKVEISDIAFYNKIFSETEAQELYAVLQARKLNDNLTSHKLDKPLNTLSTLTGYEFNSQQYITVATASPVFGSGAAGNANSTYIEFVLKSFPQTYNCVVSNGSSSRMQIASNGIYVTDWNATGGWDITASATILANTKYKLLLTVDSGISSNNLNVYLDGTLIGTASKAAATANWGNTLLVGTFNTSLTNSCDAIISKPIIFNRILNSDERTKLFAGTLGPETLFTVDI